MKVYILNEYRNCGDKITWGVFSSEENARKYLRYMRWDKDNNFGIIEYEVDEKVRWCNL